MYSVHDFTSQQSTLHAYIQHIYSYVHAYSTIILIYILYFITLIGPPQFRRRASNITVSNQHTPVSFTFDACGGTSPTVSWSRLTINGQESLPGFHNHIHASGSTLTLNYASIIGDVGEYTYTVSNSYGSISDTVYLIVFGRYLV